MEEIYETVELCKAVLGRFALSVYPSFKPDPQGCPFLLIQLWAATGKQ